MCTHNTMNSTHTHTYTYIYTLCMYVCIYVYIYVRIRIQEYANIVYTYTCVCVPCFVTVCVNAYMRGEIFAKFSPKSGNKATDRRVGLKFTFK